MEAGTKHTYQVEIEEVRRHLYNITDCNSPEEAESIAEAWLEDGEEGAVISRERVSIDSYPVDEKEDVN